MTFNLSELSADQYNYGLDALDSVARHLQREGFACACTWVRGNDESGKRLLALADAGNLVANVRRAYIEAI
jgi:hypothetical protein